MHLGCSVNNVTKSILRSTLLTSLLMFCILQPTCMKDELYKAIICAFTKDCVHSMNVRVLALKQTAFFTSEFQTSYVERSHRVDRFI